jgi:Tfp pilus assembly protein PilN
MSGTQSIEINPGILYAIGSTFVNTAMIVGGWLINYARSNARQDNHTTMLAEHGEALDRMTEAIQQLTTVTARLEERTDANRTDISRVERISEHRPPRSLPR